MKNYLPLLVLDVAPEPTNVVSWGVLVLLLAIVFVLAVSITAALLFLLIRFNRRAAPQFQPSNPNHSQAFSNSPAANDARLATMMAKKSRHIERFLIRCPCRMQVVLTSLRLQCLSVLRNARILTSHQLFSGAAFVARIKSNKHFSKAPPGQA